MIMKHFIIFFFQEIEGIISPLIINQGESLRLRAIQEFKDRFGK